VLQFVQRSCVDLLVPWLTDLGSALLSCPVLLTKTNMFLFSNLPLFFLCCSQLLFLILSSDVEDALDQKSLDVSCLLCTVLL
jgi:hypothetical protein